MPRTKFQNVVFTAIMAFFMVFGMTVYSITVQTGELTYGTLIAAITEMWIEYVIVFLIVLLFMSKLAAKIAFRFMDPHTDKPMFITLAVQTCMVMLMDGSYHDAHRQLYPQRIHRGLAPEMAHPVGALPAYGVLLADTLCRSGSSSDIPHHFQKAAPDCVSGTLIPLGG